MQNMKVITLTTYNVYNYGASLQAYALQRYIINHGHDSLLLNYQPEYLRRKYNYKWVNPESKLSKRKVTRFLYRVMKFLQRQTTMKRKKAFDHFTDMYLLQSALYPDYQSLLDNPPTADTYIVGSDQVWNSFYETGRDAAFYLDFVKKGSKNSYAASFSYLELTENIKFQIKNWLDSFNKISVREYHGIELLNTLCLNGTLVLDPVFLLSIEQWESIMIPYKKKEKYLLVYDFEGNKELKSFAKRYAKEKELKIYSINDTYPRLYANRNYSDAGPREFLSLIYNCDAFISNSFHGTAFSIIFNKPVFVFNRHRHKVNSRMESLTKLFGLEDCIITDDSQYQDAIDKEFDFESINNIRYRELIKSKAFIDSIL